MSKQLAIIEKKVMPIVQEAHDLVIVDQMSMLRGTELLSVFNGYLKESEKDRRSLTDPLEESLKLIRAKYKPIEIQLADAIKYLRGMMSSYQTEADRKAKEEADKIAARQGEGKGKFSADTAARKIEEIETAPAVVNTKAGSVSFREDKILKIIDISLIPKVYFNLDESRLLKDLKAGIKVEGANLDIIKTPINRR